MPSLKPASEMVSGGSGIISELPTLRIFRVMIIVGLYNVILPKVARNRGDASVDFRHYHCAVKAPSPRPGFEESRPATAAELEALPAITHTAVHALERCVEEHQDCGRQQRPLGADLPSREAPSAHRSILTGSFSLTLAGSSSK
jgi:hypothetical protein